VGDDITYTIGTYDDSAWVNDTGSEYTINVSSTATPGATVGGLTAGNLSFSPTYDNGTITLTDLDNFERDLLDLSEVEEMCKEYPGLKNVYEKFKHVYDLVKQDWVGKQKDDI
jgi:hypothetical protein|tara:strand:- start:342 stop:680 length:339 start_codon:yes stop_codon:yes gene_type:complete